MLNISLRFWVVVALLVAVNVAGLLLIRQEMLSRPLPGLRLLSVSAGDKIEETDRFVLKFDEPVAKLDLCGAPVEHSPFVIDPAPAGRWQWEQPDQLVYLLDTKLPAGREYVIRPAANVQASLGHRLIGESEYRFRTQPLKLTKTNIRAFDRSDVTFELTFNQPVSPGDLLRQLTVRDPVSRGNLDVQCLTKEPAAMLTVRFARPASQKFEIEVAESLAGDGGVLTLGAKLKETHTLAERFARTGVDVHQNGVEAGATVEVEFNRSLDPLQDLAGKIVIDPAIKGIGLQCRQQSLHITGPFESGRSYTVTLAPAMLAGDGQTLGRSESLRVEIPQRSPALALGVSRGVLMPDGNLTLDLKAINVESLKLSATKVHANNLVGHLRGDYDNRTSRQVVERDVTLPVKPNEPQQVAIDLKQLLDKSGGGGAPGTYRVTARAVKPRWLSDDAVVCISDLGITAKQQKGGYHVFITSLRTARPVEGVKLAAITYNNQTIAEAETDASGIGVLRAPSNHPDGPVFVITAQLGEDLSYLQPDRRQWVLDEVDQSGRQPPETYDVMLYCERGVYRPGDTIHLTGIVREPDGRTPPPLPLSIRVRRPDGRLIAELPVKTVVDKQGVFHLDVPTSSDDMTGRYTFTCTLPGSTAILGQTDALVEAFAPIRIEVTAEPVQARFGPKDQPKLRVSGRYLFGQPAAGLAMTVTPTLRAMAYESKRFPEFSFETGQPTTHLLVDRIAANLDAKGEAAAEFDVPSDQPARLWRAALTATVTEAGGRSVSQNAAVNIDKVDRHLGLRLPGKRVVSTGTPTSVEWCLVNGSDEPVTAGEVKLELFRVENDWTLQTVNGQGVWKSTERLLAVTKRVLPAGDAAVFEITCPSPGVHRLVLTEAGTKASAQLQFYAAENANEFTGPPVTSPQRLEIELDKKSYLPGEKAKAVFRSPFPGTLLVTVETTRVLQHHVLEMKANTATMELPVDAGIRGGAYITASVIRAIDPSRDKWLPHRAMGMARISTDHRDHTLDVKLQAPADAEPGQTVTIQVEAPAAGTGDGPAMVHVWAVDDGILLTTNYRTPQPQAHFFAPRAAAVTTSDLFADLLPDHRRPAGMLRIGGDGDDEEMLDKEGNAITRAAKLRRSPTDIQQREAAIIWRTAQPVGTDGRLTVDMTMPKVTGRMRIMAVVVAGDHYGSANHALALTSPLLVEANWPRFAAPGDQFDVPVKLFNSTKQPLEAELSVEVQGPVKVLLDDAQRRVTVKPDEPATVWLKAVATGVGQITAVVRAEAAESELNKPLRGDCEAKFTIRPITPLHMESQLAALPAGKSLDLKLPDVFEPGSASMKVTVSGSPTVNLRPAIEQLLDYPYGCVEQTTSRLIAILRAPQLIALDGTDDARIASARAKIEAGIARLWSMQTRSGGLGYWPGDDRPMRWGTCYAAAFLAQAHKAGFKLDAHFVDDLLKYLQAELDRSRDNDPAFDDNLRAMICRTLATFGKPQEGWTARLTERVKDLDMEGRAHLAATWFEMGRKDKALSVLPADTVAIAVQTTTNHRITSPIRQDAVLLDTLMQIDVTHAWAPLLARRLDDRRGGGYWGTTLDNAAALSALTRYQLRGARKAEFAGEIIADGAAKLRFDHTKVAATELPAQVKEASIRTTGEGEVYVTMMAEGLLKADAIKPYESNLRIARRWLTREGKPVDDAKLRVGDLIHVEVDIAALNGNAVHNIAIVDALPAGMEVENPRLATSAAAATPDGPRPDRVEYLDDRVVVFTSANAGKRTYRYALRVTGAGQFVVPPLQASCMYDATYAAMTQRGGVVIGR